jgi:pimeloyl-ACP methyl ester carboxylesterase
MTIARLQQAITLSLVGLAVIAGWYFAAAGEATRATIVPLVVLFGYAGFLAIEFVLVGVLHGDDPTPRASAWQLLRAWAGEVVTAPRVFCWRQPFRSGAEPDWLPAGAAGRRGVVLVHGFACNRGLWNPWLRRLRAADVPCIAVNLEPACGSIDAYPPIVDEAVRRMQRATGIAPLVVAHSMGGLAVRAWLATAEDAAARVQHVVTIGTPHRGTWLARFAITRNAIQMREQSRWLAALAAHESGRPPVGFTCFHSHCDNIVFPASSATLDGADNRHLPAIAHVHMAFAEEVFDEALRRLGAAVPGGRPGGAGLRPAPGRDD